VPHSNRKIAANASDGNTWLAELGCVTPGDEKPEKMLLFRPRRQRVQNGQIAKNRTRRRWRAICSGSVTEGRQRLSHLRQKKIFKINA
jgi:hypothetical protein